MGLILPTVKRALSAFIASRSSFSSLRWFLLGAHVDEVDDQQAADVAQAELAGHLAGRLEVGGERRLLLAAGAGRARPELTSMAVSASVRSMTIEPPEGSGTVRS